MRKRRVLAMLLALSLVVSGNSLTVLAAETGADQQTAVTTQDGAPGTEGTETGDKTDASGTEGTETGDKTDASGTEGTETGDKTDASGTEGTETGGQTGEPGTEGTETGDRTDASGTEGSETPETPEDPDAPKEDEAADPEEEEPVQDEAEEPVEEEKPEETAPAAQPYVSRMVTFTDDTGMSVLYDANASTQYDYVVEGGVLTAVRIKKVDADGTESFENASFKGNVELKQPEEAEKRYTSVAAGVFQGNGEITYVKLPAGVETIVEGAFKNCSALKGVYLPSSVNKIENSAFESCTSLTQISVPKAVTAIGNSAFKNDARLYLVYIKDVDFSALQTIGASAFEGCSVLSVFSSDMEFVLPSALQSIGEAAFKGCKTIRNIDFTGNTNLAAMGESVFAGCTGLTNVTFGKALDQIAQYAFDGCSALASVNFPLVGGKTMSIESFAFQNCYNLKELLLPQSVGTIKDNAFLGCTKLTKVTLRNDNIVLEPNAFPQGKVPPLMIDAVKGSLGYQYAQQHGLLPQEENFYLYTVEDVDGQPVTDGKFAGGKIWVCPAGKSAYDDNINKTNKDKKKAGVKSGEPCYIYHNQTEEQKKNYIFIKESLRCNGQPVQKTKDGKYYFEMPVGGAVITAEFRAKTPGNIKGTEVKVEFSAGEPIENGTTDKNGYLGVELKVGQTTRMFLLDTYGEPIPATKIKLSSRNTKVATVTANGMITAVGTDGKNSARAVIEATVKGGDGKEIRVNRTILVKAVKVGAINLKATDYEGKCIEIKENDGIQAAVISKTAVQSVAVPFKLKANVYDETMDGVSKNLTWTTSNDKVAAVAQKTTAAKDPVNTVTIKKGCEGEATITVTANNPTDAKKAKVTARFVVRVYREGYKLASSTVTVNPKKEDSGVIELISAYDYSPAVSDVELRYGPKSKKQGKVAEFHVEPEEETKNGCRRIHIRPVGATTIAEGKYEVVVCVNGDETNLMPLTITVKRSTPSPTIKFNEKKTKFNLFYKDGRAKAKGEPAVVLTQVTKLGNAKIAKVELSALSEKANDMLFLENFVIDNEKTNLSKGTIAIKRSEGNLQYTSDKKPAVTGNLIIYYEGFRDDAARKVKLTMPTCTTAPSYALRETSGTYRDNDQYHEGTFILYDKTSKTKEQVILGGKDSVIEALGEVRQTGTEIKDGAIAVGFFPEANAKMKFVLTNSDWDLNKEGKERSLNFTYEVKVSKKKPTIRTNRAVSLNRNYPEQPGSFWLVSDQKGFEIADSQTFIPKKTKTNAAEIEKLEVTYEDGEGTVRIADPAQLVKAGTYEFTCTPDGEQEGLAKVTLKVTVVNNKPSVTMGKGNLQLNKQVYQNNDAAQTNFAAGSNANNVLDVQEGTLYQETARKTFKVSGKPAGYTLASVGTGVEDTWIKCTTKNKKDAEDHFLFEVHEGEKEDSLEVSLRDSDLTEGEYEFSMTPRYLKEGVTTVTANPVKFKVKVIDNSSINLKVAAKGKINLVNRNGVANEKNGILYTPTLQNISGEITDVKLYDASAPTYENESQYFDIRMVTEAENKNQAGKFFVTPKEGVELNQNKDYNVRIWVKVKDYAGTANSNYGVMTKGPVKIRTAQVLPKVTTDKAALNVYLSTKQYNATFIVKPKDGAAGAIESVAFGKKDEKANDSLALIQERQADGSLKVTVHLKEGVVLANGDNNVNFFVKYIGQGANTSETATAFTMKIKVH